MGALSRIDPMGWAELARSVETVHDARSQLVEEIQQHIHVNSLMLVVGIELPSNRLQGGHKVAPHSYRQSAGVLVNEEWTAFLAAGNAMRDPLLKRLGRTSRPMFWWEDSPLHRSLNDVDLRFARHYFDHDIRLGIVDGVVDYRSRTADMLALDSRSSFREFRAFERAFGNILRLTISWLSEGIRIREMADQPVPVRLAARECECLRWTSMGLNSSEIADKLALSEATVNEYISRAMRRLGARTRVQACARATLLELISP